MAAIDRRIFLGSVLPGAVVAIAGATAITTLSSSIAEAAPFGADETGARGACDAAESAPTDVSAQHWRRQRRRYWRHRRRMRRRIRRCWWRHGRRRCGWVWV
jgi:hypothetical protein